MSQTQQDCCGGFVSNWHSPVVTAFHQGHALSASRGTPHFHMVWISMRSSPEDRRLSPLYHAWWHYPHGTQDAQQKVGERHCIALWIIKSVSVPEYWEHAALLLRQHRPYSQLLPTSTIPPWIPSQDPSPVLLGCMAGLEPQEQWGQWIQGGCELREGHQYLTGSNTLLMWDREESNRKAAREPQKYIRMKMWPHKYYCSIILQQFTSHIKVRGWVGRPLFVENNRL